MFSPPDFKGSMTALITPFREGRVDEEKFCALIDHQIAAGTHGLVPCGTTGESPTLSHEEHRRVVELCVKQAAGRIPVIAGAGSNSTAEAVAFTRHAEKTGADAVLIVTPYYNKPSQDGLYAHFQAVNDATNLPIIIYNIPGRSIVDMSVETMRRLRALPHIAGVKDATGDMARVSEQRLACGEDFRQLSGEDGSTLGFMAHGGHGCISVSANVAPAACAAFQNACLAGDYAEALRWQDKLMPLHKALFTAPSPSPVKYAASLLNLAGEEVRLPLLPLDEAARLRVRRALVHAGLLAEE